jgi:hypothetical protein
VLVMFYYSNLDNICIICDTLVCYLTDEYEEYCGNSFITPSQKNEYGKKKGCGIVVTGTI